MYRTVCTFTHIKTIYNRNMENLILAIINDQNIRVVVLYEIFRRYEIEVVERRGI